MHFGELYWKAQNFASVVIRWRRETDRERARKTEREKTKERAREKNRGKKKDMEREGIARSVNSRALSTIQLEFLGSFSLPGSRLSCGA